MADIRNITLKEFKNICEHHHKQNKDCYSCIMYKFCGGDMLIRDPSAWRLCDEDYKKEEEE